MKVLGINGSPRQGGNTDILLEKALAGARSAGAETESIVLNGLNISPVQEKEYENVNNEGFSVVDDDIQLVYRKISGSDALVLASPIFFGSLSAQVKIMIDRFQCVWVAKNVLHKDVFPRRLRGAFLCVEATARADFFENARSIVRNFFAIINAGYYGEVFCPDVEKKGEISRHAESLEKAFELGIKITSG